MIPNSPSYQEFKEILHTVCKFQLPKGVSVIVFRLPPTKKEIIGFTFPADHYGKFFYQSDFGKKPIGPFDTCEEAQRACWKAGNLNVLRSRIASIIREQGTEAVFEQTGVIIHLVVA